MTPARLAEIRRSLDGLLTPPERYAIAIADRAELIAALEAIHDEAGRWLESADFLSAFAESTLENSVAAIGPRSCAHALRSCAAAVRGGE